MIADTRAFNTDFNIKVLESDVKAGQDQIATSLRSLRQDYLKLVGQPLAEPLDAKKTAAAAAGALAGIPLLKEVFSADVTEVDFEKVSTIIKDAERSEEQDRLKKILQQITTLELLASAVDELAEEQKLLDACAKKRAAMNETRGAAFKDLYEAVNRILTDGSWPDPTLCPACESKPTTPPAEYIEKQLQQYHRVSQAQERLTEIWQQITWPLRLKKMEADLVLKTKGYGESYPAVQAAVAQGKETAESLASAFAALTQLEEARKAEIQSLQAEKKTIEVSLPPSLVALTEQVEHAKRIREQLGTHQKWLAKVLVTAQTLQRRQEWKTFIETACKTFESAEATLSKTLTTAMDGQYKDMYAKIAGGNHIVPMLQQQPGSVDLHIKLQQFFGLKDTAATPLLSESYRNALAISIFLSAALQRKTSARFIVLDDVTSSFDAGHQFELMEVLRTLVGIPLNPDGLQVIVLSHDGLLEKYFDKLGNTKEWHHQHLQGWPPQGSVMMQTQEADRLRSAAENFLKAGQVKQAEPLIRQHLEYRLLQVIGKVNIPVPLDFAIKDHLKMVSNCLDAIKESLDLHKAAGQLILTPQQQHELDTMLIPALIANWVNHYETASGASLDPYVLLGVLDTCEKYADSFKFDCTCLNPGTVTRRYYRTLASKGCKC